MPEAQKLIEQLLQLIPPMKSTISLGIQPEAKDCTKNGKYESKTRYSDFIFFWGGGGVEGKKASVNDQDIFSLFQKYGHQCQGQLFLM